MEFVGHGVDYQFVERAGDDVLHLPCSGLLEPCSLVAPPTMSMNSLSTADLQPLSKFPFERQHRGGLPPPYSKGAS